MNKYAFKSELWSSRTVGLFVLGLAVIVGIIGGVIIPVIGLIFAVPLFILAGLFFVAPESKVCRLILDKT